MKIITETKFRYVFAAIAVLLFCKTCLVTAQIPRRLGPASDEVIQKALTALKADMTDFKAHTAYIHAMGMSSPAVAAQYQKWMAEFPGDMNIPLAIGSAYYKATMPQPGDFLLKAAEMDPKNDKIWNMLAQDAFLKSDDALFAVYMGKAAQLDPSNIGYAYSMVTHSEKAAPEHYEQNIREFVKRFPEDNRGANLLASLANSSADPEKKIYYLEQVRKQYPPQHFSWSASSVIKLADMYMQTNPEKVLGLIHEVGEQSIAWDYRKQLAESLIKSAALEKEQNYTAALATLNQSKIPSFHFLRDFPSLKKAFLTSKSGDMNSAYDSLAIRFAKSPGHALNDSLLSYGLQIGKEKKEIYDDIDSIRISKASVAADFDLGLYTSNEKVSLKSLRGKVILLTFWFPGCGPCKVEFPHFQTVVDKFKSDELVYLAVNTQPSQDGFVLPFLEKNNVSFTALRGSWDFARESYGVSGAPSNFLIDRDGKIIFKNFTINDSNRDMLELMIASQLEK